MAPQTESAPPNPMAGFPGFPFPGLPATTLAPSAGAAAGSQWVSTVTDPKCEDMVDSFSLAENVSQLLEGTVKQSFASMLQGRKPDKGDVLRAMREEAKRINWLPLAFERTLGEQAAEERLDAGVVIAPDSEAEGDMELNRMATQTLDRLLAAVPEEHPYEFKVYVTRDYSWNAEAAPGGYIFVTEGALVDGKARGIMAHEIAHVLKRHTTREIQSRIIDTVKTVDQLKKAVSGDTKSLGQILGGVPFMQKLFIRYSQGQELVSDACAVRLVMGADPINGDAAVDGLLEAIKEGEEDRVDKHSSHPSYPERKKLILGMQRHVEPSL